MVPLDHVIGLSAVLFTVGVMGVLVRRNLVVMLMSIELMLNAVNLTFIAFARYLDALDGQIFVLFVMAVAAAEVAVGLAIIIAIFKRKSSADVDRVNLLKW